MIIDGRKFEKTCSCGRKHQLDTVFTVIENGALLALDKYMHQYGLTGFVTCVYDENTYRATEDRHPGCDCEIILDPVDLHANEHGVQLLQERLPDQTQVLVAIGSGTIHDITRYCAYQKGVTFVSCPTAASVDGFCSSVAAMTWHSCKKTLTAVAPRIVVADIDIIKNAPLYLAKSGFGDMVGKFISLTDWKIGSILLGEYYCSEIADMTRDATRSVMDSVSGIIKGEEKAYAALMYGLILSGLAMQMIGNSRPASGAEHHISHIIEMQPAGLGVRSDALHGEKVGVGTLLAMQEYQRIAGLTDPVFRDYSPAEPDKILAIFGEEMAQEIFEENKKDAASGVTGALLQKHWRQICAELCKLPDAKELRGLYEAFAIKSELSHIGVAGEKAEQLLSCSPLVRNRLTCMRIRNCVSG